MNLWQHERVSHLIAQNLTLTTQVRPVTNELGAGRTDTDLVLVLMKTADGKGIEQRRGHRLLYDTRHVVTNAKVSSALKPYLLPS